MMNPSELRAYEFKTAGRNAYKSEDVDNFFGEVAVNYEKMYRENAELIKRVGMLADRLEQYKADENEIKNAVISAQKAADIIVKQAEESVEDSKAEAEAILAAAKGEADIIKIDAEKQAIADSDLLLSVARDKAEQIINKAKEEAHGILIEANDSASDKVGEATRTVTSESLYYDMLKKEVSEFKASILAQYKAHIEMISKLPEIAVEEANKDLEDETVSEEVVEETIIEESTDASTLEETEETKIEFIQEEEAESIPDSLPLTEETAEDTEEETGEYVEKTTLPYDFFEETSSLEFVENSDEENGDIPEFNTDETDNRETEKYDESSDITEETEETEYSEEEKLPADIPISRGFSVDKSVVEENNSVFSSEKNDPLSILKSIETIDAESTEETEGAVEPKRRGLF
ncbi:MAG: DivIVA domain-containing protein, partial [Oscillospiraceae bacterium]|nr:DivIVA domain-containing protein [Oscillospiraceae bacterium]